MTRRMQSKQNHEGSSEGKCNANLKDHPEIQKNQLKPQLFPSWKVHAVQLKIIIFSIYQIPYESCSR